MKIMLFIFSVLGFIGAVVKYKGKKNRMRIVKGMELIA